MSLLLVADNTAPTSLPPGYRPGYRQSLSDRTCQKCLMTGSSVRTVGVRRRGEVHWKRLALCPACVEIAREQGFPVVS